MTEEIDKTFKLATSYTIGSYIIPGEPIDKIQEIVKRKIQLSVIPCDKILASVKSGEFELGIIESHLRDDELIFEEWMRDELVVCSRKPLPDNFGEESISYCKLICRPKGALTRIFITDFLEKFNLSYYSFGSLIEMDSPTALIQSVKWSRPNTEHPTVAIVSQLAIESELKYEELYQSRINNTPMVRKFHFIYDKNRVNIDEIHEIIDSLKE